MSSSQWWQSKGVPVFSIPVPSKDQGHGGGVSFPVGAPSLPIPGKLGTAHSSVEPAWPVPLLSQSVLGQVVRERGAEARGDVLGGCRAVGALWHPEAALALFSQGPAPQSSMPPKRAPCLTPAYWRRVRGLWGQGVCSLHSNPSCVSSIPTLPVSPPCHSTAMCPPHAIPLCVLSIPIPHISPPCQPSTCSLHIALCVPSIPILYLSCRGHPATKTCCPMEIPISQGPHQRGGGGVGASDVPP